MIAPELDRTATVRDLLFGDQPGTPTETLAASMHEYGILSRTLPTVPGLPAAVEQQLAAATDELLGINLADLLATGWRRHEALRQAARRTQNAPTAQEVVSLATHTIESSQYPSVELFLDGRSLATIDIQLQISFTLAGVLAVVRQARLTAIRAGRCTATGTLAIQQTVVAKCQRRLDLPGAVEFRRGVALLVDARTSAPTLTPTVKR